MGGISMFARSISSVVVAGLALISFTAACSKDNASGGGGGRPPAPGEIPEAISVPADQITSGLATDTVRTVESIDAFRITKWPITVGRYRSCVAAGACTAPNAKSFACSQMAGSAGLQASTYSEINNDAVPLTCATPEQATAYCAWLGAKLPTSEQWLYAARGKVPQRFPWGAAPGTCAQSPVALSPTTHRACCSDAAGCDTSKLIVGASTAGASPTGVEDILLTPAELIAGDSSSHFSVCANAAFACAATGTVPAAIDSFSAAASAADESHPSAATYGFRCVWEGT